MTFPFLDMRNKNLNDAIQNKKDEFYTQYCDIKNELVNYKEHFKDKIVYCNCDDYKRSNFYKFFKNNFEEFQIKELITTCYNKKDLFHSTIDIGSITTIDGFTEIYLSNGDFRCSESIELLKRCDIVVTNPPFSLWGPYIRQLLKYNKKFIIIGNVNSFNKKYVMNAFLANKLWLGKTMRRNATEFELHDSYESDTINEDGKKMARITNCRWFTNLQYSGECPKIKLKASYTPKNYEKYDNCNAINIDRIPNIPKDYYGLMGVPITYLDLHDSSKFEVLDNIVKGLTISDRSMYARLIIRRK